MSETCTKCGQDIQLTDRIVKVITKLQAAGKPRSIRSIAKHTGSSIGGVQSAVAKLLDAERVEWPRDSAGRRIPGMASIPKQRRKRTTH